MIPATSAQEAPQRGVPAPPKASTDFPRELARLAGSLGKPDYQHPDALGARVASSMLFRLLARPAAERYALLRAWTLPDQDRTELRHFVGFLPDAPPPAIFLDEPVPPYDDPLISTFAMLVEAARETGELDRLAEELKPFVAARRKGAELLWLLVQLERQDPAADDALPVMTRKVRSERLGFDPQGRTSRSPVPLHYGLLVKSALRFPRTRDRATELHGELLQQAKESASFGMILWLYRTGGLAAVAATEGATLKPGRDPGLRHWTPVDLATGRNVNVFGSTSWWLAAEDRVGHVCSPWVDHLVFAYPLTGSFRIECETYNALWSEANTAFSGFVYEAWNRASDNQVFPFSGHEVVLGPNPRERDEDFNPVTIEVQPDLLRVTGLDQVLVEAPAPSTTSPFLALRTTWLSAFRDLRIVGDPVIPREVTLLDGDRMDGWVTSFYGETQPPLLTIGQPIPDRPGEVVTRRDAPDAYDWSTSEGELRGRRVADVEAISRESGYRHGESWIYYHRPLREGDRIEYEFFHRPGADGVEVHPTFDRMVFLLRPDGVRLHWLTTNRSVEGRESWVETDNRAEDASARRGPAELPFQLDDWNRAVVEIRGGLVRIELNGVLICERPVDPDWGVGTRFGLYHDRLKTSARVRNVRLTGDWPEWSPKLAARLLERSRPLSRADQKAIEAILTPRLLRTPLAREP